MTARRSPRTLVLASLPRLCEVCWGQGLVRLAGPTLPRARAKVPCPHCKWGLPIAHIPVRP